MLDLAKIVRDVPDFPEEGILFRDVTPVLQSSEALGETVDRLCAELSDVDFDLVLGPESRGFIFGVPVAYAMKKGFVPVRKPGKLPCEVVRKSYDLEYGSNVLEIHKDAIKPGDKVVIVDDLIATGGTTKAIIELVESLGGEVVRLAFFIELEALKGREMLEGYDVRALVKY